MLCHPGTAVAVEVPNNRWKTFSFQQIMYPLQKYAHFLAKMSTYLAIFLIRKTPSKDCCQLGQVQCTLSQILMGANEPTAPFLPSPLGLPPSPALMEPPLICLLKHCWWKMQLYFYDILMQILTWSTD